MSPADAALLVAAGIAAGVVNSLAGAGSLLTVSLLVVLGLPGNLANGTNRVGVLVQNLVAAWRFRAEGVSGFRDAGPLLVPVILGSVVGALLISSLADETFETLFGLVMIALLFPILRRPTPAARAGGAPGRGTLAVFFAIGLYGGAFQAGVGIALVFALAYAGYDLVRANSIKMVVNAALVAMAVPVFALRHQIDWSYALVLSVGFVLGAEIGARVAVRGGERAIRPVLALAVVALAGRMIGLY